jgi:hypothetical protein
MPAASYTRSELRTQVLRELQDPSAVYFSTDLLDDLLNDAMQEWCEQTLLNVVNGSIDLVANQAVYSLTGLSPRAIRVKRLSCPYSAGADTDRQLEIIGQDELEQKFPNWRSQPASWPLVAIRDLAGPQSLRLHPAPSSSQAATILAGTFTVSGTTGAIVDITGLTSVQATALYGATVDIQFLSGSLLVYYAAGAVDITSDSTTVETACGISPDFQDALRFFILARCCEIDTPISQQAKAAGYWQKWQTIVDQAKRLETAGMQSRPAASFTGSNF